jgi:hypothetical protein
MVALQKPISSLQYIEPSQGASAHIDKDKTRRNSESQISSIDEEERMGFVNGHDQSFRNGSSGLVY